MIQDFFAQHRGLMGDLLAGVFIPAGLVGMGMLAYWLNARRVAAERNVTGASAESDVARTRPSARPASPSRP